MSDLNHYIQKRSQVDSEFAENLEAGYSSFKLGILLRQAREEMQMSSEELAQKLNIHKSLIEQVEDQAETVSLAMLEQYAQAVGKKLLVQVQSF